MHDLIGYLFYFFLKDDISDSIFSIKHIKKNSQFITRYFRLIDRILKSQGGKTNYLDVYYLDKFKKIQDKIEKYFKQKKISMATKNIIYETFNLYQEYLNISKQPNYSILKSFILQNQKWLKILFDIDHNIGDINYNKIFNLIRDIDNIIKFKNITTYYKIQIEYYDQFFEIRDIRGFLELRYKSLEWIKSPQPIKRNRINILLNHA